MTWKEHLAQFEQEKQDAIAKTREEDIAKANEAVAKTREEYIAKTNEAVAKTREETAVKLLRYQTDIDIVCKATNLPKMRVVELARTNGIPL